MNSDAFLDGLAQFLKLIGMIITSILLVGFTLLLLIGDIIFGMMAWETITSDQLVAIILEAVPNLGIIAIGMTVAWRKGFGSIWNNMSFGVVLFLTLAFLLGTIDATKDAYGVWVSIPAMEYGGPSEILGWIAVLFVFVLSAFGEILALGLPEFLRAAVDSAGEAGFDFGNVVFQDLTPDQPSE